MKITSALFLFITFSFFGISQDNNELYRLNKISNNLKYQIDSLQYEFDSIKKEILLIEYQKEHLKASEFKKSGIKTITTTNVKLRNGPSPFFDPLLEIPKGGEIKVHSINVNYYEVEYQGKFGWVNGGFIKKSEDFKFLIIKSKTKNQASNSLTTNTDSNSKPKQTTKYKSSFAKSYSNKTWVKGHYRTRNGKRFWVKGHYRKY